MTLGIQLNVPFSYIPVLYMEHRDGGLFAPSEESESGGVGGPVAKVVTTPGRRQMMTKWDYTYISPVQYSR